MFSPVQRAEDGSLRNWDEEDESLIVDEELTTDEKLKEIANKDNIKPENLLGKFLLLQAVLGRVDKEKAEKALDDFLTCLDEEIIEAYKRMEVENEIK
jgi:hypothetical protein